MDKLPNGLVTVVNLPGTGSILHRSWHLYEKHFAQFCVFSLLLAVGLLLNAGLGALLATLSPSGDSTVHGLVAVGISAINLFSGFYLVFIFCGLLVFLNQLRQGEQLTVSQALEKGRAHVKSVFWITIILSMVLYGSLFTGILFVLFSFWYYFALYVSIVDGATGTTALAKSRYLTHGMFFKIAGRYLAILVLLFGLYLLAYISLGIPVVGAALFIILALAISFFALPFFIIYDFIRYVDVAAVQRTVDFIEFRGERAGIVAWTVFGCIFFTFIWTINLLSEDAQVNFARTMSTQAAQVILPYAKEVQVNLKTLSGFLGVPANSPSTTPTLDEMKKLLDTNTQ